MSINREQLNRQFRQEYERLNEQQQKAVDSLEGPVMVIAGPGTGKTQILASRIGKILLDTDALPHNILCLTYTDAGVVAMRKRLVSFIGPDAYKVNIYTFHAFCNDIIQDNLSLFEKTALDPISELERIELFKKLIDEFPKNHILKRYRGDVYFEINNLQSLFSTMKREGWTPEFLLQKIDEYLERLKEDEAFKYQTTRAGKWEKGAFKPAYFEETERMEKLRAAVNEFTPFQQKMRARNRYDFDDMINWVINAFEENPYLLSRYQEQYLYVLVDEYQDTSGTQNKLVELLINFWEKPNVFVVGDDDQSIYRFQGANVENMLTFANNYRDDLMTVVLTNNYRSTQPILDISRALIERNQERLIKQVKGLSKDLKSSNEKLLSLDFQPLIKEYETPMQEMTGITLQVQQLLEQGVPPGKIGVIYRENKYGEELSQFFKQRGVPVYSKRSMNLLHIPLAKKIILVLRYLAAERDVPNGGGEMLFEILHFDWFGVPPMDIATLSIEVADRQFGNKKVSLRQLLNDKILRPKVDLFSQGLHPGLQKAGMVLEKLIANSVNLTLQQLFETLIREAGVLTMIMESAEKIWHMQVVTALFDFIKEETRRNPTMNLAQLVNIIDLMEKEDLRLPLTQVTGSDKGVNLMTAHGSKGLEFLYVFFVGCNAGSWEKKRKPGGGYKLPDTVFSSTAEGSDEEELRRLFYVALTRAEQHLYISYSQFKNDGKSPQEPSMFIAEIRDQYPLPVEKMVLEDSLLTDFQALAFEEPVVPEISHVEREFVNRLLDKFVMSVTALNNYLRCPLEFYFKNLIRIPSPKNEATEFGSAIHFALEKLFTRLKDNENQFAPKQVLLDDFNWFMHRHRESFTREQFNRRLEYGLEVLSNYYEKYIHTFNKYVAIEHTIRQVVNGIPLKGKVDKLEFEGKAVNVVDYKSGDIEKAREKLRPPSEKDPNGGDYWRQAVFYKILVDNNDRDWRVVSTEFDFIEPDKKKNYRREKIVINPADITTVSQQIATVWQKIQAHDFYTGCGKEDCHWCRFVKTNNMAVALHALQEEEEVQD